MTLRVRGLTDYARLGDNSSSNPSAGKTRSSVNNLAVVKCAHVPEIIN